MCAARKRRAIFPHQRARGCRHSTGVYPTTRLAPPPGFYASNIARTALRTRPIIRGSFRDGRRPKNRVRGPARVPHGANPQHACKSPYKTNPNSQDLRFLRDALFGVSLCVALVIITGPHILIPLDTKFLHEYERTKTSQLCVLHLPPPRPGLNRHLDGQRLMLSRNSLTDLARFLHPNRSVLRAAEDSRPSSSTTVDSHPM